MTSTQRIAELSLCFIGAAIDPPRAAPEFPRNFAVGAFSNPREAHDAMNGAPHSLQNFNPSGFSVSHFAQIIPIQLRARLIDQRLGIFQVGGIEAFGEPVVDFGKHRLSFIAPALLSEETSEACRCAQLERLGLVPACNCSIGQGDSLRY
jgi:hypothetical protein